MRIRCPDGCFVLALLCRFLVSTREIENAVI
jgi:hypothetical protein